MSQDYCAEQVRLYDYENYVLILFAPREKRDALWAVYALKVELSRIRSLIREPMMGLIRIEWWRESVAKLYAGEVLRHEVLQALAPIIAQENILFDDLLALINAYELDLENTAFPSLEEATEHAENMSYPLLKIAAILLKQDISADDLKIIAIADFMTKALLQQDMRFNSYKEFIKKTLPETVRSVNFKSSFFVLLKFIIIRRIKMINAGKIRNNALLSFHLWLHSLRFF